MNLKKFLFIYIIITFISFPVFSVAFNQDDVYVWSDFSSKSTSIEPTEQENQNDNTIQDSR